MAKRIVFLQVEPVQEKCCACTRILGKTAWRVEESQNSPEFSAPEFCTSCKETAAQLLDADPAEATGIFELLDAIRESGHTNMFAAANEIVEFWETKDGEPVSRGDARVFLRWWMDTFAERHKE